MESVQSCRIPVPFQEDPGSPKGEGECAHMFRDAHSNRGTYTYRELLLPIHPSAICIYIRAHRHSWSNANRGRVKHCWSRFNWLWLWVCISLDPSSGGSPFRLMKRLVFVWTEGTGTKMWRNDSKGWRESRKEKEWRRWCPAKAKNSWINMLFLAKNNLKHVGSNFPRNNPL